MYSINEEEEEDADNDQEMINVSVDRYPSVRPPSELNHHYPRNNNISLNKQTTRTNFQLTNRSASVPSRQTFSSNLNSRRRRNVSDSYQNNQARATSLVTSFIQYLRSELRASSNDRKYHHSHSLEKKSIEDTNDLSRTFNLSNQFYRQQYPIRMNTSSNSDDQEISKLINLLLLRVECLTNENPTIKQVDQNLIEYLYYLFNKFTRDESESNETMIDKSNFVNVCQKLVRNGCLNSSSSEPPLLQTILHEYQSPSNEHISTSSNTDQDTWLVVDFEPKYSATMPNLSKCLLPSSTSDEQLFNPNDNYFSFEELQSSCASESSQSNYYSPDDSLVDLSTMVQELDEINNTNNNNNTLFIEDGSNIVDQPSSPSNQLDDNETSNSNKICSGLTNDEHLSTSTMESTDHLPIKGKEKTNRREQKLQERWTMSTKVDNHSPNKTFLGVEFPPIAVLRRKFSSSPSPSPPPPPPILNPPLKKRKDISSTITKTLLDQIESKNPSKSNDQISSTIFKSSMSPGKEQEINASFVNPTEHVQVLDRRLNDSSSLNYIQSPLTTISELLTDEKNVRKDMNMNRCEQPISSLPASIGMDAEIGHSSPSSSSSSTTTTSLSMAASPSTVQTTHTNEKKTTEILLKEIEEEEKKEEELGDGDDDNVDREKKNNSNVEHDDHASGTILINSEPTQVCLREQEKEEQEEQIERSSKHLQSEDVYSLPDLPEIIMNTMDVNEQRYKSVEIEEISDEDEDLSICNNSLIEPTDCILTDDELKPSPSTIKSTKSPTHQPDPVISCYETALPKTVETIDESIKPPNASQIPLSPKRSQRPEDDPIALRALQRFEERMNAAAAAAVTKNHNDEASPLTLKGKSSWSGTHSTPRKSIENLFKANQQSSDGEESSAPSRDTFIRPRKSMLDENGLNFGMTLNLFGTVLNDPNQEQAKEQQPPIAIVEDDNKQIEPPTTNMIESEDFQQQHEQINRHTSMTNENNDHNGVDDSNSLPTSFVDQSSNESISNMVISHSSTEQQSVTPYRLQLEGRRRLNTLERIRARHQNQESTELHQPQQLQLQSEYTLKPEDLQDPIIRRALERFDEKSRALTQAKPPSYDDIQDPITRRAVMRLESNLKRTMPANPPPPINTELENTWYTNSYTLGSLQSNNDHRFTRYSDSIAPATSNLKPSHVSVHQRFASTDMSEVTPNQILTNNDPNIPILRVPPQPVYVTSNPQPPISFRHRSRSEDMLASRELSLSQEGNSDDQPPMELQRNHSSNELQQDVFLPNEMDMPVPNTMIKTLDPNFVRSGEKSVNYSTPTQTYSAYSCEFTRPHRNLSMNSSQSEHFSPRNQQQDNEIQSSSAFVPVHPPANNFYPPPPAYQSTYAPNNPQSIPYSDDPIIRRALERFNCQMQNSFMNTNQPQANMNYLPRQLSNGYLSRPGNFDSFHPADLQQPEGWMHGNRPMPPTPNTATGYQSIIGRRRQMRHDDVYHDPNSIGNGYSTSLFVNPQNSNLYMNFPDEPPAIPPRMHRDVYREQQEYLSANINNNNNNGHHSGYVQHPYPDGMINGFHPANHQYISGDYFQPAPPDEYLRHRAQSTSSNTSSDSINQIRLMQQRVPPTSARTNLSLHQNISMDHSQIPSDPTASSNGNSGANESIFHRLAYTATKSSLSKSSSNLCANLLTKPSQQQQQQQGNKSGAEELDYDDSISNTEPNPDSMSTSTNASNKCQRSRSVDGRARMKNAQIRANNATRSTTTNYDDSNSSSTVPSSKFTPINPRRDIAAPPPRIPTTLRSTIVDRTLSAKRVPNTNNLPYTKNGHGTRARGSNGNLIDAENEENLSFNDSYQPKIIETKARTTTRYSSAQNHIQTSASTSSVNSTHSRTRVPIPISSTLDRRDSNISSSDISRLSKRSDEHRILSPTGQRRTIPVSVFAPAKHESKPPVPSSPSPSNESNLTYNSESHLEQPASFSSSTNESHYANIHHENEFNGKHSPNTSALESSSGSLLNELSLTQDKHDHNKKMNVFERLFRGHKKKI